MLSVVIPIHNEEPSILPLYDSLDLGAGSAPKAVRDYCEIFAGGKQVSLNNTSHSLVLREDDVHHAKQTDLDELGIAKTAREEKKRARDEKLKQQEDERMAKLYRQHVLKEQPRKSSCAIWIIRCRTA